MAPVVFPLLEATAAGDGRKKIPLYEVERAVLAVAELPRRPDYLVQYRLQSCGTGDGTEHAADRALLLPQSLVAPTELLGVECLGRAHRTDSTSGFRETAQNDPLTKENLLPLSI